MQSLRAASLATAYPHYDYAHLDSARAQSQFHYGGVQQEQQTGDQLDQPAANHQEGLQLEQSTAANLCYLTPSKALLEHYDFHQPKEAQQQQSEEQRSQLYQHQNNVSGADLRFVAPVGVAGSQPEVENAHYQQQAGAFFYTTDVATADFSLGFQSNNEQQANPNCHQSEQLAHFVPDPEPHVAPQLQANLSYADHQQQQQQQVYPNYAPHYNQLVTHDESRSSIERLLVSNQMQQQQPQAESFNAGYEHRLEPNTAASYNQQQPVYQTLESTPFSSSELAQENNEPLFQHQHLEVEQLHLNQQLQQQQHYLEPARIPELQVSAQPLYTQPSAARENGAQCVFAVQQLERENEKEFGQPAPSTHTGTNADSGSNSSLCSSPPLSSEESSLFGTLTRDEKRAREANIPLSYHQIVNLSIDQFNEQLLRHQLTESQLTLIKDIRRRGKNKVAAQSCRRRKMEQIYELQHEVDQLAQKRRSLNCERNQLITEHTNLVQKYNRIYAAIQDKLQQRHDHQHPHQHQLQVQQQKNPFEVV